MRSRTLLVVAGLVLVISACGSSGEEDVTAFEEIAVSGPAIEADPSGTAVFLTVETSIDAVCAVSYGEGRPVGNLATDREMDPEGHAEHRVVLSGLEPDTEYQYRLQGVGADGRLYRSDVFTFRTSPATESRLGPNLAVGASVVDVSSEFSSAFAGGNAVDGDPGTEWSSRGDGDDAYVTIDLGREVDVTAVAFRTREMSDGSAITLSFTVEADGSAGYGPFDVGDMPVEASFRATVLRFDIHESTGGNTGAVEIEVYGSEP